MSYETTFKLKKELDDEFKSHSLVSNLLFEEYVEQLKNLLIAQCLFDDENINRDTLSLLYDKIKLNCTLYVNKLIEYWKISLMNELKEHNETVYFNGWKFSPKAILQSTFQNITEIINYFTKELLFISITKTKTPLDNDNSDYYAKRDKIQEIINDIPSSVFDFWDFKFINRYRNSLDAEEIGE